MNMLISQLNSTKYYEPEFVKRKEYVDFLRIIASVAVVFVHVVSNTLTTSTNDQFTNWLLAFGGGLDGVYQYFL